MIVSLLATALLIAPAPDPRQVADEVASLLEAGKVNEALAAIEAANAAAPDPRYLFMRAALEEQLGRCSVAVPLYREFYAESDDALDRAEAQSGLERCGADPEPEPVSEPESEPVSEPPAPRVEPPEQATPTPPPRWQRDPWGWSLLGSGAAVAVAGGVVFSLGNAAADDTRAATLQSDHHTASARAQRLQPVGIALIAAGSALWVGGVLRMMVGQGRRPGRNGQMATFRGTTIFF